MRTLLMAGAASLAALAFPATLSAQTTGTSAAIAAEAGLNTEQQARYDAWPADRRATFDTLDREEQDYFWTLTPQQQDAWWILTPDQRAQIRGMEPETHARAWASIEQQVAAQQQNESESRVLARPDGPTAGAQAGAQTGDDLTTGAGQVAAAGELRFESNEVAQNVPGDAPSEYPLCRGDADDRCINPWEAGQRGAGVNRPLDHWPGRPASEAG